MANWTDRAVDIGSGFYFYEGAGGVGQILDEEGNHMAHVANADWARAWLGGYLLGLTRGEAVGAEKVRRAMRDVLGVPHPNGGVGP